MKKRPYEYLNRILLSLTIAVVFFGVPGMEPRVLWLMIFGLLLLCTAWFLNRSTEGMAQPLIAFGFATLFLAALVFSHIAPFPKFQIPEKEEGLGHKERLARA
jgi:hypothetical protein